jgi:hypothetical protein
MNSGGVAELAGRVRWGARGFDPYVGLRFVHCSHPCWPVLRAAKLTMMLVEVGSGLGIGLFYVGPHAPTRQRYHRRFGCLR